jgi:hypothetical protein
MSTPSGNLSHSVALSDDLVRNARERAPAEAAAAQSSNDPPPSPYAPKRALRHADASAHARGNDPPSAQVVLDWRRTKEAASIARHVASAAQAQTTPRAAATGDAPAAERQESNVEERQVLSAVQQAVEAARKAINESPLRVDDLLLAPQTATGAAGNRQGATDQAPTVIDRLSGEQLLDPEPSVSLQPQSADGGRTREASGGPRAKIICEIDVEKLEASLRRLNRRQAAAIRLPPAPKLPLTSRRVPPDVAADACIVETKVRSFHRSLRSLEPIRLAPPPIASSRHPNTMLGVSIGCTVIAGILYYYLETGRSSASKATPQSQVAYVVPQPPSATESNPWARPEPLQIAANADHKKVPEAEKSPQPTATAAATISAQQEPVPTGPPLLVASAAGPGGAASGKPPRKLDAESIALLIKEAEKHISTGDVVTARMIFQRVAEAGDATAALELAATYDPTVLAKLGVMGMGADVEKARAWYRTAESFGSAEAKQRLRSLDRQ